MSKVGSWSTTPGNNNSTPPDGWPEGQAPSTVNDCAREMMASVRTVFNDTGFFDPGNTPSCLTSTTFSLGTSDVATFHIGRRLKLFDSTTLYGTIDSVSATFVSVRLDSGALTASLSSVAVGVIAAVNTPLPDNMVGNRSVILNGNMEIWQRGNTFSASGGGVNTYTADRWAYVQSSGASVVITRAERSANSNNVPSLALAGQYLNSSLRVSVSAADATLAAGEVAGFNYKIEGYDWRQLAHRPCLLSFFVNSNCTGVYTVALRSGLGSASFLQNFTLSAASTWSKFSITVPEAPTTVTWDYSSGTGAQVTFTLAAGSGWQGGAGNWTAANLVSTSTQKNFLASAGNVFMVTGVSLRSGSQAGPLEIRPYAEELAMCQRYYFRGLFGTAFNFPSYTANVIMSWPVAFPAQMRITPTVATVTPGITMTNMVSTPSISLATPNGARIIANASLASVNTNFTYVDGDYFEADAEL